MARGRRPKFTAEEADRIKRDWQESDKTMVFVAKLWKTSPGTVDRIIMGKYTPIEEWENFNYEK